MPRKARPAFSAKYDEVARLMDERRHRDRLQKTQSAESQPLTQKSLSQLPPVEEEFRSQWLKEAGQGLDSEMSSQLPDDGGELLDFHDDDKPRLHTDGEKALDMINQILNRARSQDDDEPMDDAEPADGENSDGPEQITAPGGINSFLDTVSPAVNFYPDNTAGFDDEDDDDFEDDTRKDASETATMRSSQASILTETLTGTMESQDNMEAASIDSRTLDAEKTPLLDNSPLPDNPPVSDQLSSRNIPAIPTSSSMPTNARPRGVVNVTTKLLEHTPVPINMSEFAFAFTLWVDHNNITRQAYRELMEVFKLAKSLQDLQELSTRKETMRKKLYKSLPLVALRQKKLELDKTLLPSRAQIHEDLLAFDLKSILQAFLSSDENMPLIHRGLAHLIDTPVEEPWQARWWGESIRTTSGHCAYDSNNDPLWPSDFVRYLCGKSSCNTCDDSGHIGRIIYVGRDFRSTAVTQGDIVLEVQEVYITSTLPVSMKDCSWQARFSLPSDGHVELVVIEDGRHYISCNQVHGRLPYVHMDYKFDPSLSPEPLTSPYTVRYFFHSGRKKFYPTRLTTALRGEMEIMVFTREYLLQHFTNTEIISLPMFLFADAFGLFRNMYRSLLGIYLIPQFLPRDLRTRRSNLMPLTLGPFGAEDADVFECLTYLCELDSGVEVEIQGKKVFVCSFVGAILGDMPSQQKLAGCRTHSALKPCRYCLISILDRDQLEYNIFEFGRYGEQLLLDSARIREEPRKTHQEKMAKDLGISVRWRLMDVLDTLFPAIDRIRGRPIDAAHSEYQGLAKTFLSLIFNSVLTGPGSDEINEAYRVIAFPPGWRRLQSPKKHLDSWRMQELARGAILLPIVLRYSLKIEHIKPELQHTIIYHSNTCFRKSDFPGSADFTSVEWLTAAAWVFAQSLIRTCAPYTPGQREAMEIAVRDGRRAIQLVCFACSSGTKMKSGEDWELPPSADTQVPQGEKGADTRPVTTMGPPTSKPPASKPPARKAPARKAPARKAPARKAASSKAPSSKAASSKAPSSEAPASEAPSSEMPASEAPSVAQSGIKKPKARTKASEFEDKAKLPNIHTGLHHGEVADEYGGCRMATTLQGEDKHKEYKADILSTNFRNAAATLIQRERVRITISMLSENCFPDHPEVQNLFLKIRERCPTFAKSMNSTAREELEIEEENESKMELQGDNSHQKPRALGYIAPKNIPSTSEFDFLTIKRLNRLPEDHDFLRQLQEAYYNDYKETRMIYRIQDTKIQWSQKLAFTPSNGDRVCFTVGDFVRLRRPNNTVQYAKLLGLFTHKRYSTSHLFAVVDLATERKEGETRELVLNCPIFDLNHKQMIIGLPHIQSSKVWMVQRPDKSVLFIDYDVYFM